MWREQYASHLFACLSPRTDRFDEDLPQMGRYTLMSANIAPRKKLLEAILSNGEVAHALGPTVPPEKFDLSSFVRLLGVLKEKNDKRSTWCHFDPLSIDQAPQHSVYLHSDSPTSTRRFEWTEICHLQWNHRAASHLLLDNQGCPLATGDWGWYGALGQAQPWDAYALRGTRRAYLATAKGKYRLRLSQEKILVD